LIDFFTAMATATLISSNSNLGGNNVTNAHYNGHQSNSQLHGQQQPQKIHFTARPYIIDNQVQQTSWLNNI
jgi:hypothetical protein